MDKLYHLPFEGEVVISQGWNGPFSHFKGSMPQSDMSYAVDFKLPWGSEVRAARSGRLIMFYDKHVVWYSGDDPSIGRNIRTNLAVLQHDDDQLSYYSHLEIGSVRHNQSRFSIGDVIATTGRSGWIPENYPHLHFMVANNIRTASQSVPFGFVDYRESLEDKDTRQII